MSVSLTKGQKVDLTKGNAQLDVLNVGLGWDPVKSGGLFSRSQAMDIDASAILLDQHGKLVTRSNLVYFGNLQSGCRSVVHSGDNLTGAGSGDDEVIAVHLSKVPQDVHRIVFVVNIFDCTNRRQDFGQVRNAYIRVVDKSKRSEVLRFNLTDDYSGKTSLVVGEVYRYNGEWKFSAVGRGSQDRTLQELVSSITQ